VKANTDPRDAGSNSLPSGLTQPAMQPLSVVPRDEQNDCLWVAENLSAYLDEALDPATLRRFEKHIGDCLRCAADLKMFLEKDRLIQREWRQTAPLPSSSQVRQSVDAIMDALPPAPEVPATFASKRVHARARWMRFSTGLTGLLAFFGMLWSSYRLGYLHGQKSVVALPMAAPQLPVTSLWSGAPMPASTLFRDPLRAHSSSLALPTPSR
jgi:anti-sigma factor RsiW